MTDSVSLLTSYEDNPRFESAEGQEHPVLFRTWRPATRRNLPPVQCARSLGVKRPRREATTHLHPLRNLRISGATPQLLLYACMPCTGSKEHLSTRCSYTRIWLSIYLENNSTQTETILNAHFGWEWRFVLVRSQPRLKTENGYRT